MVAENHRDEFKAVAQYLNDMAERDPDRGIAVWLVEAKAIRIAGSPWAPLFMAVLEPNQFTATVEQAKQTERAPTLPEFLERCNSPAIREAIEAVTKRWSQMGHRQWIWPNYINLVAKGPAKSGERSVVALYRDGRVLVPFGAYAGQNTGIPIGPLSTPKFRANANAVFGFTGTLTQERTPAEWLTPERTGIVLDFASYVANAYLEALGATSTDVGE